MNLDGEAPTEPAALKPVDRWLLSRLARTESIVRAAYDAYDPQSACQALYRFFWSELCDWYIEVSKPRLQDPAQRQTPLFVLLTSIEAFLKMLHPVMPHLTEELYGHLPIAGKSEFLMSSSWPEIPASFLDEASEAAVERVFEITRAFRALRAALDLTPGKEIPEAAYEGNLAGGEAVLRSQAWIGKLSVGKPAGRHLSATREGVDLHLPIEGLVDLERLIERDGRDLAKKQEDAAKLRAKLENPQFIERAKPEVVEKDRALLESLDVEIEKIGERIALLNA